MIVIAGSPRKGKYSDRIAEKLAELTGSEVIYARSLKIGPCRGCDYCRSKGNGNCIQNDDMASLLDAIRASDGLAIVSPIYWWQTTAQTKLVIDRLYALGEEELKGKTFAVIMNGAEPNLDDPEYDLLSRQFGEMAKYAGMNYFFLGLGTPEDDGNALSMALARTEEFANLIAK